jgi:hypothetical protein
MPFVSNPSNNLSMLVLEQFFEREAFALTCFVSSWSIAMQEFASKGDQEESFSIRSHCNSERGHCSWSVASRRRKIL